MILFYFTGVKIVNPYNVWVIVEDILSSENIDEVFPAIAKRTVYNYSDLQKILEKKTLVILFRYVARLETPKSLIFLDNNIAAPQSYTYLTETIEELCNKLGVK